MIDYICGRLAELNPVYAVIDCSGVGYEVNISMLDYAAMQGLSEAKLYIHESIREDAHVLFGFTTRRGRELFRLLIGVSGVGPNTARMILSALTTGELEAAIASGNEASLKSVKGIGGKTAQRIIVDLKDKIKPMGDALINQVPKASEAYDEALSALVMLGFTTQQSNKVLKKMFSEQPGLSVEEAIKCALKML